MPTSREVFSNLLAQRASLRQSLASPLSYSFAVCTGSAESGQFLFVSLK